MAFSRRARLRALARKPGHERFFALADQGLQGVAGLAAFAVFGRALPTHEFGALGIAIGAYFFAVGFHRSAIVLPYLTEHQVFPDAAAEQAYHSDWWWLSVAGSLVVALALAAIAMVLPWVSSELTWLVKPGLLGAIITLPMAAAEFGRRWLYRLGRPEMAALLSLVFFAVLVAGAIGVALVNPTAPSALACWFAGSSAATVVALVVGRIRRPRWRVSLSLFGQHWPFSMWLVMNLVPYTVYSTATVVMLVGGLFGPQAAAVFTAARTLTNPAVSITSAIDSIDKPRAARALAEGGVGGLAASVRSMRWMIVALTGLYLGLVMILAGPLIDLVFSGEYAEAASEVRLLAIAFFLFCLNLPSETFLIVLRRSKTLFLTRLLTAIVTLIALIVALPYGIRGMAVAIAVSQGTNIVFLYLAERRLRIQDLQPARS